VLTVALLFLFLACVTALLGFGFLAASAAGVAHLCLLLFAVLFVFSIVKSVRPFGTGKSASGKDQRV